MKKKLVVIVIAAIILSFLTGTGFVERNDVILTNYTVSEDGTKLLFQVAVPSSMGYVRGFTDKGGGVKAHYLTFYATFGGLNSSLGAKQTFELSLAEADSEIFFHRPDGGYTLILQKDSKTGAWIRP